MCLAQGPQHSDAGETRTRGPSVLSQALYHWATALPYQSADQVGLVSWLIIIWLELEQKTHGSTSDQTTPKSFFHNAGDKISEEWQIKYVKLTN